MKRHFPSLFMVSHWSYRSRDRLLAFPLLSISLSFLQMMKENPGTPWMHLLALLIRKSMPQSAAGISTPPKLDIASTIKVLPMSFTTFATDSISFRIPEVVSLWTMDTWVISGSSFMIFLMILAEGTLSYSSRYST